MKLKVFMNPEKYLTLKYLL